MLSRASRKTHDLRFDRNDSGAVFFELAIAVPVFVMILGLVLAIATPLNSRASATSVARDLARYGVAYDLTIPRDDGTGIKTTCEAVCDRAVPTLCSHGLESSRFTLSMSKVGDSFSVELRRNGVAFVSNFVSPQEFSQASFALENSALEGWDPTGCDSCILGSCPATPS